jgi:hypothetical protein
MRVGCVREERGESGASTERHFGGAAGAAGIAKSVGATGVLASAELIVMTCLSLSAESFGPDASEKGK